MTKQPPPVVRPRPLTAAELRKLVGAGGITRIVVTDGKINA
jgi:hypothetical protein